MEDRLAPEHAGLKPIGGRGDLFLIGADASAAVDLSPAIRCLDVGLAGNLVLAGGVVVVEERAVIVIALDQTPAGRIVVRDGQQQRGPLRKRKLRLHQSFSERALADRKSVV